MVDFISKPFQEQEPYDALARHGGVRLASKGLAESSPSPPSLTAEDFTLDKQPTEWCDASRQALTLGNISKIKRLGAEARCAAPLRADFLLERIALYDLNALKQLLNLNGL